MNAIDPGQKGSFAVKTFLYAGPANSRSPEYRAAALRTAPVDISPFFRPRDGLGNYLLRRAEYYDRVNARHWGFDESAVPLNAKVWYPVGAGPYPVVVCVHGNHDPYEASEFGYGYLGEHLASRGIIFASVDENFLNGSSDGRENDARAALLLLHLRELARQDGDPASPLFGKVDEANMGLIGHSRGGEAVVTAEIFNELGVLPDDASVGFEPRLSIKGVVSLAPIEGQYRPSQKGLMFDDANYLSLQGSSDGDVDGDYASRFVNRGAPRPGRFRAGYWIYGANHGYFNTTWAEHVGEMPAPTANLLSPEDQRKAATILVTAFFEASFGLRPEYKAFLKDFRSGLDWLPATLYSSRWRQGGEVALADFEEDADPRSGSAPGWRAEAKGFSRWREGMLPLDSGVWFFSPEVSDRSRQTMNQGSCAVFLSGPAEGASYSLRGPARPATSLIFDIGYRGPASPFAPLEARFVVEFANGSRLERRLSELFPLPPSPGSYTVSKGLSYPYLLQTLALPLPADSAVVGFDFLPEADAAVEWYLDRIVIANEGGL